MALHFVVHCVATLISSMRQTHGLKTSDATLRHLYDGFVKVDKVETSAGLRPREVVVATDSVAFLVCNKDRDEVLLATHDRAPMMRPDNPRGTILEVGAGRFDIRIGVRGLVVKELKEELGVTATEDEVHMLNNEIPLALSPGVLTERHTPISSVAAIDLEKLLARGEPLAEHGPKLVACLLNAHEDVLPGDAAKIEALLRQLDAAGHSAIATDLRRQLAAKQYASASKPWWKFWK